jgi:hypothetical protein
MEGITIRNGHINKITGELEKSSLREFECELPLMKVRVQTVSENCTESIPIFIRAP